MNILDRILYLQRQYYDQCYQAATVVQIGLNLYHQLLDELEKTELTDLHGMRIDIISENTIKIEY